MNYLLPLIEFNLAALVLLGFYLLFMRRTKHFKANRIFLNSIPILSGLSLILTESIEQPTFMITLPEILVNGEVEMMSDFSSSSLDPLLSLWLLGLIAALSISILKLRRMNKAFSQSESGLGAFSFMGRIHIDASAGEYESERMHRHELVHVREMHSLDVIWYELWKVICWFNPTFYIGQQLVKEQHEYLADEQMIEEDEDYPSLLVAHVFGLEHLPLANEFKGINIKNRIEMMNKERTRTQSVKWYSGLTLAMLALVCISWTGFNGLPSIDLPTEVTQDRIYEEVDKMPQFPGCENMDMNEADMAKCSMKMLMQYMYTEVKYPEGAENMGQEGTVMVKYTVTNEGEIRDVVIEQSVSTELNAEALRVVSSMPNWIPGELDGEKVNVSMVLPIKFALGD